MAGPPPYPGSNLPNMGGATLPPPALASGGADQGGWGMLLARMLSTMPGGKTLNASMGMSESDVWNSQISGFAGSIAKLGSGVMVAVSVFEKVGKELSGFMDSINDSTTTFAQKMEKVPIISTLHSLANAFAGTADKLNRISLAFDVAQERLKAANAGVAGRDAAAWGSRSAEAHAGSLANNQIGGYAPFLSGADRGTAFGAIEYQQQVQYQAAQDAIVRAQAGFETAYKEDELAKQHSKETGTYAMGAFVKAKDARTAYGDNRDKENLFQGNFDPTNPFASAGGLGVRAGLFGRDKVKARGLLNDWSTREDELGAGVSSHEAAVNKAKETGVKLAQAESEVRKANIEYAKTELAITNERISRMSAIQKNLGSTGYGTQEQNFRAFVDLQKRGIENAPQALIQMARQFDAGGVDALAENAGAKMAKYWADRLKQEGIDPNKTTYKDFTDGKTLENERKRGTALEMDVRAQVAFDEKKLADALAKTLAAFSENLVKVLDLKIKQAGEAVKRKQAEGFENK